MLAEQDRQPARTVEGGSDRDSLSFNLPAESSGRGVLVTDTDGRIQFTDPCFCDLLGIDAAQVMGRDIGEVVSSTLKHRFTDPEAFEHQSARLHEHPEDTAEDVLELASPERRVLHRYSAPLLDENRLPTGRIEVYSDITRRRHLEEANAGLFKQVKVAYEELKATQDQLLQSEKLRAVGEIAAGVAHDFNNTLGIILGNIQLLLRGAGDPKMRSRLQAVEQAALDGAETIRRIQEFTRIQPDEAAAPVDLSLLASSVIEVMKPGWENSMHAKGCRIDINLDLADDVLAAGVAPEIREVLANVILNSVQAMPDGGTLDIRTGREGSSAWIRIQDTGIGMSDEVCSRVFDPFFTTKGVEGTGLGMSVAYGIVKRHRGKVGIDSKPGDGTVVTISIPVARQASVESAEEQPAAEPVTSARILVVDDEEMFAQVIVDMLSEYGHAVCTVSSGPEAIRRFQDEPFDLVFTDLGMPDMSGWQVARGIKDISPGVPVVLLTGWGAKVDADEMAESQVDMVLSKPVNMEELSGIVSSVLSKRP